MSCNHGFAKAVRSLCDDVVDAKIRKINVRVVRLSLHAIDDAPPRDTLVDIDGKQLILREGGRGRAGRVID